MVPATSKLKLRGRWNTSRPLSLMEHRERKTVDRYIPGTYQASNKENTKCNDKTSAGVTAKKRRKQGKRQRSACQEQPETRGMMEHDTRRVGYSLWCGWVVRDRSTYIGTSDKVQHKNSHRGRMCKIPGGTGCVRDEENRLM